MFDVHTHLASTGFEQPLETLLQEAYSAGVHDILVVSEGLHDAQDVLALPSHSQGVRIHKALGLHPEKADLAALPDMLSLIRGHKDTLACVGEIGLDYSPHILGTEDPEGVKAVQQECMRAQVALANELGLAVNVHSRSAGHHAIALLHECGCQRVVLHAFDGKAHYAEAAASAAAAAAAPAPGFYFSVPPCAKRSPLMQKWMKRIPLERLLLETDSPALAAEKGQINVPQNLVISCELVAEIKGVSKEEVVRVTRHNAEALFGITR